MDVAANPAGELVFTAAATRSSLSRRAKAGKAVRLAAGVYAVGATLPIAAVAKHHRMPIISHHWPGAVLCGRSAFAGGVPVDGWMFVAHPDPGRVRDLHLPGFSIAVEIGPAALPGDTPMPAGLALSGRARQLVENVHLQGRPPRSRAGTVAVEDRIDELARRGGAGAVQATLGELDVIAGSFDTRAVELVRARLAAVVGTSSGRVTSSRLRARLDGVPFDAHRIDLVAGLATLLRDRPPEPRPAMGGTTRWEWLPFFEAYFSNFIEGTEFGVEEARRIAIHGEVPADRPADAHDVAATYRLAADPEDRGQRPGSGDDLLDLLTHRHAVLLAARPDKRPGQLKVRANFAGGYQFVEPELVEGTLRRGFDTISALTDPFARAVSMMALVTECHPFDDGNGRVARLTANAELTAADETRIVVPTVYRNNYLVALTAFSNGAGRGDALVSVLDFAQRWVTAVDWSGFDMAKGELDGCNAFVDPAIADATGQKLRLPP